MSDANLGDGANGLSEAEKVDVAAAIKDSFYEARDQGRTMHQAADDPRIVAVVERIVREHTERAWDEGFALADRLWQGSEYNEVTWAPDLTANPYRAARQEQA